MHKQKSKKDCEIVLKLYAGHALEDVVDETYATFGEKLLRTGGK